MPTQPKRAFRMKKGGVPKRTPPFCRQMLWELVGAAAAGGTTAAATAPSRVGKGISGSTEKPMYVRSMVTPPTVSRRSPAMQKVNPSCSKTLSSGVGSSRARARRGPRQPPAARYTRIGVFSLSAKYASSSWEAVSLIVNMVVSSGINDEEGKRTNAGKRHIRLLQKVVCKSQMAREPFVRAFLTESLFAQRKPRRMVRLWAESAREGL